MICAAIFNPATGKLLLSTAEGYYAMDPFSGTFTALPFTPAPAPSPNLSLNPIATPNPYVLATNPTTGDIQILNLTTNAVTTVSASAVGVTTPGAAVIDPLTNYAAVVDAATGEQSLLNVAAPQSPVPRPLVGLGVCGAPEPANLNMVAMGISANAVQNNTAHTLFTSQTSGNCVGFEAPWPTDASQPLLSSAIFYGYGSMPATPDSQPFINGNDANAIAAFNSVYDQNNYGLLVDANQQWVAKIKIASVLSDAGIGAGNGSAAALPGQSLCDVQHNHLSACAQRFRHALGFEHQLWKLERGNAKRLDSGDSGRYWRCDSDGSNFHSGRERKRLLIAE
jgi:hypothetical protein